MLQKANTFSTFILDLTPKGGDIYIKINVDLIMRQVPHYLVIGNGRVAKHFAHYLAEVNLSFNTWHRQQSTAELKQLLNQATHVLILISDQAINDFIIHHLQNTDILKIHFSGSVVTPHAFGAHPLMTFSEQLYTLDQYQEIPFVLDHDAPDFSYLMPGLVNPHVRLDKSLKAKYHALSVLSGNFSCMLWQKFMSTLENEFNIPKDIVYPYMRQQTKNLLDNYKAALTGPLVRDDKITIEKNLLALQADPFKQVYQSFVSCYQIHSGNMK